MTDAATHGTRVVAERLRNEFGGIFSPETINAAVQDSYDKVAEGARVTMYLDLFTEKFARESLRSVAELKGRMAVDIPVLGHSPNRDVSTKAE